MLLKSLAEGGSSLSGIALKGHLSLQMMNSHRSKPTIAVPILCMRK